MKLKSIKFSNIYNFIEEQEIIFDSKCNTYVIIGNNATGKTNLLDIIENASHSMYRKPDFKNLQRIRNMNSDSSLINFASQFILKGIEYCYSYEIDIEKKCYTKQRLVDLTDSKLLFDYNNGVLTSDVLSPTHILGLSAFNIKANGVMVYVNELDEAEDTVLVQRVRKYAKLQDYIEFELDNFKNSNIKENMIKTLNDLDIDVRDIKIRYPENMFKKKIQNRIVERRKNNSIKYNNDLEVILIYDNYEANIKNESKGTVKVFDLCLELYAANSDQFFVPRLIDEMSTSLSSEAFFFILNEFIERTNRQLVFTTNNQILLENKTLPKESVIFVEKTDNGSMISKLSDYKFVRNDKRHNWRKLYNNKLLSCRCIDKSN